MPASAETRAAADLVRAEQLAALGGAQPVAALAGVQPVTAPIDYNVPYSPAPVAPVAPTPISAPAAPAGPGSQNFFGNDPALGLTSQDVPRYSILEGAEDVASSGNTFPVGAGPFPTLEAGVYGGPGQNYYGNDPTAGLITADAPRYSLLESAGDVASSGNTYLVGTGPQPGLGAGVYPVGSSTPRAAPATQVIQPVTGYTNYSKKEDVFSPGDLYYYAQGSEGRTVGEHRGLAGLADRGRYGDSMLVHMAPEEVAGLASLTQNGVTINPETGLPEMFNLKSILPTIVGIGAGFLLPPVGAAIASGLATAAFSEGTASERIGKGLLAGIGSWGMGKLSGMLGGAGAAADPTAAMGVGALPDGGAGLFRGGVSVPWEGLDEAMQQTLIKQGVTAQTYPALIQKASANLGAMPKSLTVSGAPTAGPYGPIPSEAVGTQDLVRDFYQNPSLARTSSGRALRDFRSDSAMYPLSQSPVPQMWGTRGPGRMGQFSPQTFMQGNPEIPGNLRQEWFPPYKQYRYAGDKWQPVLGPKGLGAFKTTPPDLSYTQEQLQQAAAGAFDPALKAAQARSAYEGAGLLGERFDLGKRLGYIGEGLGQVDLTSWKPTAPGRLGLGDIATPAAASLAGFGAMLPEEEYKVSGRSTYDDQGPYFPAERRRRRLPPGYIPGVSPQLPYFAAMGGTRGKTVSGGLPTIYARGGMDGSSVMVGGERIPRSYGEGKKHVELAYVTPDEQRLLRDVDMYDSNPPHPGPAGIPNFNTGGDDPGESTDPSIGEAEGAAMAEATASVAADMATEGRPFGWFESVNRAAAKAAQVNPNAPPGENWGYGHTAMMNLQQPANTVEGMISRGMAGSMGILGGFAAEQAGKAGLSVEDPSFAPGVSEIGGPSATDLLPPTASTLLDTDEEERRVQEEEERQRMLALPVGQTLAGVPPASYRPGIDPQFSYFAQRGTEGMTIEENIDVETATEMPAGVAATSGIMQGAPVAVQDDVGARLSERQAEEPQNPRERAIYDRAVLALQNELEPEVAQRAIDEFLEVFGPEALHMLQEMVRGERENGGTVETFSGETTIAEGELQGPDVIAGKIVDPVTGEETANLRVGENEYIEPADSLARRAQVAGLPPTPENGAMLRGQEERMLRQAVG